MTHRLPPFSRGRWKGLVVGAWALLAAHAAVAAECTGDNLIDALSVEERAELDAAIAGVPHARGLQWEATKGAARILMIGTYHFNDPRHDATIAALRPQIANADALLVEAGPAEEERLSAALAADPTLMVNTDSPTLPERLSPEEWERLSQALAERGMPAVMSAKLRPWYAATMLGFSPCMLEQVAETGEAGGLDQRLIEAAESEGVPVRALEPWDTLFTLFAGMSPAEELDMIRAALPAADHADDYAVTLADAYFAGESWLIWEFGRLDAYRTSGLDRAAVDAQVALMRENLMDRRNRAWIAPLTGAAEAAAGRGKGIVAAFGALHLPGAEGVLSLLEREGWTVSPR